MHRSDLESSLNNTTDERPIILENNCDDETREERLTGEFTKRLSTLSTLSRTTSRKSYKLSRKWTLKDELARRKYSKWQQKGTDITGENGNCIDDCLTLTTIYRSASTANA
jgi:hypothetical protein